MNQFKLSISVSGKGTEHCGKKRKLLWVCVTVKIRNGAKAKAAVWQQWLQDCAFEFVESFQVYKMYQINLKCKLYEQYLAKLRTPQMR